MISSSKKRALIAGLSALMAAGSLSVLAAEPEMAQSAGQDMKDAAHSTKSAVKKTGHKVKRSVKKGVNATKEEANEAADKVKEKAK